MGVSSNVVTIKGKNPAGESIPVAVDDTGILQTLMSGEYSGSPSVVAMDGAGHMLARVMDAEDPWENSESIGLAELAVRINSPPLMYDRRGMVVRTDDFETGPEKYTTSTTNAVVQLSNTYAYTGNFSLMARTNGTVNDTTIIEWKVFDVHDDAIVGFGTMFSADDISNSTLTFKSTKRTLATCYIGELRYEHTATTEIISYKNSSGAYIKIADVTSVSGSPESFGTMKIVIDTETNKYVRILAFGNEYDVDEDLFPSTDYGQPAILAGVTLIAQNAAVKTIYIDNIVITEKEPLT